MKTFKKLIICFVCFVVLLASLVSPASAVYGNEWLYDAESGVYYVPYAPSYEFPTMTLLQDSPNFELFSPNDLFWAHMPSYIQDIAYAAFTPFVESGKYKIPFICVVHAGDFIRVFAGWNICIARLGQYSVSSKTTSWSNLFLCCFPTISDSYGNSVLYVANYNPNQLDNPVTPWVSVTPTAYGTTGKCLQYGGFVIPPSAGYDFYLYGGSFGRSSAASFKVDLTPPTNDSGVSVDYYVAQVVQSPTSGFASGTFISGPGDFSRSYFSYFSPETIEQQQASTSKGIWETIKELPSVLMDKIESFFQNFLNYILYFQKDKPEHVNPFADILTDVKEFFENQMDDLTDFKSSLSSTLDNVVGYIQSGSGVVNTFLSAVPILSAFVTFFVVFCIVRKVIGR